MKSPIFIIGYPRSGNTWLARLLGDYLDSPVKAVNGDALADEGHDRKGDYIIRQKHERKKPPNGKIVFIHRDPRDIAVSVMHYWGCKSLDEVLTEDHGELPKRWFVEMLHPTHGWSAFMRKWLIDWRDNIDVITSYETLKANTEDEFSRIVETLDIEADNDRIADVVYRQSFDVRRDEIANAPNNKYPYGKNHQLFAMRKGEVGDWKNYFEDRHIEIADRYWSEIREVL